jgi:hypothetical protein
LGQGLLFSSNIPSAQQWKSCWSVWCRNICWWPV